jgi:hypothetical protein
VGQAEPPAEAAQLLQLGPAQAAHFAHEAGHVAGEDLGDEPVAWSGQGHHDEPAIVATPLLLDQPAAHEVADDDGGVAVAAQQLGAEIALAERPVMEQRLQHAELADRESGPGHHVAHAGGHRLGGPHQLDVGVERGRLQGCARVARGHRSNLNGL